MSRRNDDNRLIGGFAIVPDLDGRFAFEDHRGAGKAPHQRPTAEERLEADAVLHLGLTAMKEACSRLPDAPTAQTLTTK